MANKDFIKAQQQSPEEQKNRAFLQIEDAVENGRSFAAIVETGSGEAKVFFSIREAHHLAALLAYAAGTDVHLLATVFCTIEDHILKHPGLQEKIADMKEIVRKRIVSNSN
jgi:hypothetical protein